MINFQFYRYRYSLRDLQRKQLDYHAGLYSLSLTTNTMRFDIII